MRIHDQKVRGLKDECAREHIYHYLHQARNQKYGIINIHPKYPEF